MAGYAEKANGGERSLGRAWPAVTNVSPVSSDLVVHHQGGVLWATVVVKATFQLAHGETARCVAPLALVHRDEPNSPGGSLARARETAPHVPNTGVVLTGHAHAPHGRTVPSMSVRLGVARETAVLNKLLHVYGPRTSQRPLAITPFRSMPLVYERAFGGVGVFENPVGTGGPGSANLPNIVDPKDPRRVAGFGPISGEWTPRRALLGGVNPAALEESVFKAPDGFDWGYFQAAPPDQQIDGIRGDEWIVLDGMHPHFPRVQSRLPGVRALAVRRLATGPDQPIELRPDLLVIDADDVRASVVWRGRFAVDSLDALSTTSVLVGLELPGSRVDWPQRATNLRGGEMPAALTRDIDFATLLRKPVPFAVGRSGTPPPSSPVARVPSCSTGTMEVQLDKVFRRAAPFSEATATVAFPPNATLDVHSLHRGPTLPFLAAEATPEPLLAASSLVRPLPMSTGTIDLDPAQVLRVAAPFGKTVLAPSTASPAPVATAQPVVSRSLAPEVVGLPPFVAPLSPSEDEPIVPPPPIASPSSLARGPVASAPPTEVTTLASSGSAQAREAVIERIRDKKPLANLKLRGADLHDLDLRGVALKGHDLRNANLRGANLSAVDLSGALLSGANLTEIDAPGSVWDKASLSGAVFLGAQLRGATFHGAALEGAVFERADLSCASLQRAAGKSVNLRGAKLEAADLRQAQIPSAMLDGADMRDVSATRADLSGASLVGADLFSANLRAAKLCGADLTHAKTDGADLRDAEIAGIEIDPSTARLLKLRLQR